jgi:hypothetical protein
VVVIDANIDTKVTLFLEESFSFYLFQFTRNNGCDEFIDVFTAVECDFYSFIVNVDLPTGFWSLKVYGQDDYSNLNPANATLVFEDMARIINAADECLL